MEQITLKLDDATLEKMKARMVKKECKTLSQCARELIDLALRIEEAAASDNNNSNEMDMMELVKNTLISSLETRFLIRFLLQHSPQMDTETMAEFIKTAKEKAHNAVNDMAGSKKSVA